MSSDTEAEGWEAVADQLRAHGVPDRRAEIAARIDAGQSRSEVATAMGIESRGSVQNQVEEYRKTLENSKWLATHGVEI